MFSGGGGYISVLVVDSNSPDGTSEIVRKLKKEYPNLHLLMQKRKEGLASAYIEGFKQVQKFGYEIFVQMDADFQHPMDVLPEMIAKTEYCDLVIGSRYIKDGNWNNKFIDKKYFLSLCGNLYARSILGCSIKDLTGGYNVWTKKAIEKIDLNQIKSKGFSFQIEMKYLTYKNKLKISEYPIKFNVRRSGQTKMTLDIITEGLIKVWKIKDTK